MCLPGVFQGEVGGTKEVEGFGPGVESLSGSPSSVIMRRRLLCGRRDWRAGEVSGAWSCILSPLVREGGEGCLPLLVRVSACVDELFLIGGGRGLVFADVSVKSKDNASLTRKMSSAWAPPAIERMWHGPCGEGSYWMTHHIVNGGHRKARLSTRARRLVETKGAREWEGMFFLHACN